MFNGKSFNEKFLLTRTYCDFARAINCTRKFTCVFACACACDRTRLRNSVNFSHAMTVLGYLPNEKEVWD